MITRNRIRTVLTLATVAMAIVGLTIPSANAKIIVEEQFIYEPLEANIDGQNGGIGFDGPWISTISHGRIYWVHSPGLSFSTLPVAGNALSRLGSAGRAEAHRLISGASQTSLTGDGTTMWFRALFQEPVNQFKHGSFLFGTDAFTTDGTPTLSAAGEGFGFTIQAAPSGSTQGTGTINALAFDGSTTPTVVEGTFTPDPITATVLIVGKINWKADGTPDELYLFNVTDLSTEPLEGTAFASITNLDFSQSAFDLIAMWDSNNSITDEIRFGNTFADLMGVVKTESSSDPSPADDALLTEFMMGILATTLTWKPGDFAESHNVYFGDDFDAVNDGTGDTFQGNQPKAVAYFIVGYGYTPEDPLPGGLVPGTTYYWRIDEVNDTDPNSPWKGDIWSFRLPPTKAYEPAPTDGSTFIDPNADLSWEPGMGGVVQTVYIGEDYDAVNNGTVEGVQVGEAAYDPGPLEYDTTYYWRVETAGPTYGQIKGDVWSFTTTLPGLGTIVSERWDNIDGQDLDALKNYWKYPNNPDTTEVLTRFSSTPGLDSYGGRIHGWLYVPSTGDYTFWLNTDDNGELWLSTNDDSTNIELIAQESSYTGLNAWGNGEEQSDPIPLQAGEKYYIMALWKEGGGGDHCQVAWQGPGVPERMVIPGTNLSPYKPLKAFGANPFNRTTGVTQTPVLQWKPGIQAASHELYFGTDEDVVRNATKASPEYVGPIALGSESYDPGKLAWESTYYWRVDEVNNTNPESPWVGSVWNFTTADYAIVDDFEDYNVTDNQIWAIWHDGIGYWDLDGLFHPGNGTGSGVGDEDNDVTYMEETIFHSGNMSMPYFYKNNDPTKAKYSEAKKTLVKTRDWTEGGVKALSLWFRGNPPDFLEDPAGTFTFSADGADIWTGSDEFRYVYKQMSGDGEIIARVVSIGGPGDNEWRKAGVMIRETLDPASLHAFMAVTPEPSHGLAFQYRDGVDPADSDSEHGVDSQTAPYWVKLVRQGNQFTGYHSPDGITWTMKDASGVEDDAMNPVTIPMASNVYVGLALTSHQSGVLCVGQFSDVATSGLVTGAWQVADIGTIMPEEGTNDPEPMYVAISNSNGTTGTVYYEDNDNIDTNATLVDTWTEWNIDLKDFQDQGVNLADVNSIAIGIGTRGSTTPGGEGKVYIDEVRLYRPRCVPNKVTLSEADFDSNCIVDFRDLEIMVGDWLASDPDLTTDLNTDSTVNFKDYAVWADQWLDEQLWPQW